MKAPPLPDHVLGLLEHERAEPPPAGMKARVAARLGLGPPAPWWSAPAVKVVAVVAAAGGTAGWLATRRPPPPAAILARPPAVSPPAVRAPQEPPPVAPVDVPARARAESEVRLLQRARAALARHDARQALAAIARHRRRWPAGDLAQERDVLDIQALILAGAAAEARDRADRFLRRHPESTLVGTVRQLRASAAGRGGAPPE